MRVLCCSLLIASLGCAESHLADAAPAIDTDNASYPDAAWLGRPGDVPLPAMPGVSVAGSPQPDVGPFVCEEGSASSPGTVTYHVRCEQVRPRTPDGHAWTCWDLPVGGETVCSSSGRSQLPSTPDWECQRRGQMIDCIAPADLPDRREEYWVCWFEGPTRVCVHDSVERYPFDPPPGN